MALASPWSAEPDPEPDENTQQGQSEPDPAAGDADTGSDTSAEIVPLPTAQPAETHDRSPARQQLPNVARAWYVEGRDTAKASLDGSVWRERPPSLRDMHARIDRAEWSGDIPALRAAGQAFGYLSLALTAAGYSALWVVRRPLRLALAAAVVTALLILAS